VAEGAGLTVQEAGVAILMAEEVAFILVGMRSMNISAVITNAISGMAAGGAMGKAIAGGLILTDGSSGFASKRKWASFL
jgi:hypothetical protein